MTVFALLFTLDAIGISIASYLIQKRRAAEQPICLIGQDCSVVLKSKYNKLFLIHNDVAGLLFYISAAVITALLLLDIGNPDLLIWGMGLLLAAGSLMSFVFTYLQWRVIKAWCFWCVVSAGIVWCKTLIYATYYSFF
jgi:uncharacterized membrane protein